ncbi:MAG TPA: DUF4126 domain-containing protein, partial [Baekduia sp.]|nr:DUF4126 domain-containing protein [Baekduia sp.]
AVLLVAGALTAEGIHAGRATLRPVATTLTGGIANPVLSLLEDLGALAIALAAIVAPLIAATLVLLLFLAIGVSLALARRLRDRRRAARSVKAAPP